MAWAILTINHANRLVFQLAAGHSRLSDSSGQSYHVYAGDKVELSGWALMDGSCCEYSSNLSNFASVLLGAFHLSAPGTGETHTASVARVWTCFRIISRK